jgi:hypothetical protein
MFSDKPEHLLVAEAGTDAQSRFAVLAGVRVDDPAVAAQQLAQTDDERILEVMQALATDVRICFAAKGKLQEDWACAFMAVLVDHKFPSTFRPLTVHVRHTLDVDLDGVSEYLAAVDYGAIQVRARRVDASERYLRLPDLIARRFHEAAEDDVDRPSVARAKYDRIVPRLRLVEDLGCNLTYGAGAAFSAALVRTSFRVAT